MLKLKEIRLRRVLKKMRATGEKVAMEYLRAYFFLDFLLTFLSRTERMRAHEHN